MRSVYLLAIIAVWAALYLPGLGSRELQGEEARRVLPGRTMLQNGDFAVPRSGGKIYNRKPPLINWISAGAITLTGNMDEWTVRVPSTLCVLALALTTFLALRSWLGDEVCLLSALILLTNIGFLEKGRLIEIEALYFSLYGMALVLWLGLRMQGRPVAGWLVCGLVSGLAFLAKGPPHLVYLYLIVICVLKAEGKLKDLVKWPHWVSLGLFAAVWLPWALMNLTSNPDKDSASEWTSQITHRLGFFEFDFVNYLLQIPQSLVNFLPWALFIPLWFKLPASEADSERGRYIRALRLGTIIGFIAIAVLPSSRPRFMLPCNVSAAILTAHALVMAGPEFIAKVSLPWRWVTWLIAFIAACITVTGLLEPHEESHNVALIASLLVTVGITIWLLVKRNDQPGSALQLGARVSLALIAGVAAFASVVTPHINARDELRPFARKVVEITGHDEPVVLFRVGEKMWPFYLGMNCIEITDLRLRPKPTRWMIMTQEMWEDARIKEEIIERLRPPVVTHSLVSPADHIPLVLHEFRTDPSN